MTNNIPEKYFELDYYPNITEDEVKTNDYMKLSLADIRDLGATFAPVSDVLKGAKQKVNVERLYQISDMPVGSHLAEAKKGGFLGMCFDDSNNLVGNATFKPVDSISQVAGIPVDPATLFAAAMLAQIEHRLDTIEEIQKEILTFLNRDKETKLEGDLRTLVDIINNCKYNWDNDTYKRSNHKQAGDIKKEAQQNVLFYRKSIIDVLNKKKGLLMESKLQDKVKKLQSDFKYYQLSVYLYGFASFLEVLLSGNYKSEYIQNVATQIEDMSYDYRDLYTKSYDKVERLSDKTVESAVLDGTAFVSKNVGKAFSKIPVVKKTPIDELLISASEKLDAFDEKTTAQRLDLFNENRDSGVNMFVDNCRTLDALYNRPKMVLVDEDALYLKPMATT